MILFLSFLTGFSGILYELSFSQLSAAFQGGTSLRYSLCIAGFMVFMGLGAFFFKAENKDKLIKNLFLTELVSFYLGLLSPLLLILIFKNFSSAVFDVSFYGLVFVLGFVLGLELPILERLYKKNSSGAILFFDYLGMFFSALAFSLFLFPQLGSFKSLAVGVTANLIAIFLLCFLKKPNKTEMFFVLFTFLIYIGFLANIEKITTRYQQIYVGS